jgi:hypothetical protein
MAGNPKWKPGMPSPNKSGRPRGIVDKRMRLNKALMDDASALLQVTKAKAMEGDMTAMALLLARAVPTLKAESAERVAFAFDASKPLSDQLAAIAQAAADGAITLEQAHQFSEIAKALATVRAMESGGSGTESALINAFRDFASKVPV